MRARLLAFTDRGYDLAVRLGAVLNGEVSRCGADCTLTDWTAGAFEEANVLIFVGAAGIAVRAVAPHIKCKTEDPAVLVVDETGTYVIPILSGHLGGANALARRVAAYTGGQAVITTATDRNSVFAVDLWAKAQNCAVLEPERIKNISAPLLAGKPVEFESEWPITGSVPDGLDSGNTSGFSVSVTRKQDDRLHLVPRIAFLGVGCRRGTTKQSIEEAFHALTKGFSLCPEAICQVCTIDRKASEPGLLAFCAAHGWRLMAYSPEDLSAVPGEFSASPFVAKTVGVDNVCERAAVLGSGGSLLIPKQAGSGTTMAVALAPYTPNWRWEDV